VVYLVAYLWLIDAQDGEIAWWHVVLMVFSQLRAFIGAILRGEPVLTGPGDAVANMAVMRNTSSSTLPRESNQPPTPPGKHPLWQRTNHNRVTNEGFPASRSSSADQWDGPRPGAPSR
jgi:hypothetical protein